MDDCKTALSGAGADCLVVSTFAREGASVISSCLPHSELRAFIKNYTSGGRTEQSGAVIMRFGLNHYVGILMAPDAVRAFVSCTADDYVAVVDLKNLEVTGKIDVGGKPDGLAGLFANNA